MCKSSVLAGLIFPVVFIATGVAFAPHSRAFIGIDAVMYGFHPRALFSR